MTLATAAATAARHVVRTWKSRRHDQLIATTAKIYFRRLPSVFAVSPTLSFSTDAGLRNNEKAPLHVTFVNRNGDKLTVEFKEGQTLLDVAINKDLNLEGFGACGGCISCSTCHVIMQKADYDRVERMSEEERDLLELSPYLTETSRLGCQVEVTRELDGMVVRLPAGSPDAREIS